MKAIKVSEVNSAGIKAAAEKAGVEFIHRIADNGETGDNRCVLYLVAGDEVVDTNGDPVWSPSADDLVALGLGFCR
jgi:hypothetical protein